MSYSSSYLWYVKRGLSRVCKECNELTLVQETDCCDFKFGRSANKNDLVGEGLDNCG